MSARKVKLLRNGHNQIVNIPRDLELPGDEAILRKDGDRLIIEPAPKMTLVELLKTLDPIEEEFPSVEDF